MCKIKEYLDKIAKGEYVPSTIKHALSEFVFVKWMTPEGTFDDEMRESICQDLVQVIETIVDQGHSGFSLTYLIKQLTVLLKQEPLAPLTGEADEWVQVQDNLYMNKRCSRVAKYSKDKEAYDIEGQVYYEKNVDKDGNEYKTYFIKTPFKSITFPYTPTTEYLPAE